MKFYDYINEAKKVKIINNKYLEFPDKSMTSLGSDVFVIATDNKGDYIKITIISGEYYVDVNNKWDKGFKTLKQLVTWMNKNNFVHYVGIDRIK